MKRYAVAVLSLALAARVLGASSSKDADCSGCHEQGGATFKASVHGSLACTDCHNKVKAYPHAENARKVDCGTCHTDSTSAVAGGVHATASEQPCKGCHGDSHRILAAKDPKSPIYPLNLPRTCGGCHGDAKFAKKHGIPEVYSMYMDSIHGFALTKDGLLVAASCSSCHGSHKILSSKDPKSRTARGNVPSTCGACHGGPKEAYLSGIHGKSMEKRNEGAPVCTDCHTTHQIASVRTAAWQTQTTSTCGGCHADQFKTYRDTFHAQVSALGYVETAHCWDCHGFHDIQPASNAKSMVARANLETTCGKCHAGVNKSFVSYAPHGDSHNRDTYPMLYYSRLFMNLLLSSVLGFFALHTILWFIRSRFDGPAGPIAQAPGQR